MTRKGRITGIERENLTTCTITQGVKRDQQRYYEDSSQYAGGNGTYMSNFHTEPHIYLYLTMYENGEYEEEKITIDIRDAILQKNSKMRVSSQKLKSVQENNVGKKVSFEWDPQSGVVTFDDQLVL